MKIKLQGIGIIKDSEIELNGLTVITGDNNSGKTTVGKVVYSLIDAVSDLPEKAENDKNTYAQKALREVANASLLFSNCSRYIEGFEEDFPCLHTFFVRRPFVYSKPNAISDTNDLYIEIKRFRETKLDTLNDIIKKIPSDLLNRRIYRSNVKKSTGDIEESIRDGLDHSIEILECLFENLENDPQLIDYARENIYQTLSVEFMGQIQPIKVDAKKSAVVVEESGRTCFSFKIADNKVINNDERVYFDSPIKKAFFVDNPFVLDSGSGRFRNFYISEYSDTSIIDENILNKDRIHSHEIKLANFLRKTSTTVFESNVLEKRFSGINAKINDVLSGDFEFSDDGDYYIDKGVKLRFSNLATGSKLFSILKLLVNKGAINDSTLLVLDEPEAHLHPAWQNKFAEVIVMLVKELNVKVLLTSHSPNFVLAIDAFMRKYEINNKTNFYQTHLMDDGFAEYVNVDEDMGAIYSDFVQYLTEVKVLRDRYMRNLGDNDV